MICALLNLISKNCLLFLFLLVWNRSTWRKLLIKKHLCIFINYYTCIPYTYIPINTFLTYIPLHTFLYIHSYTYIPIHTFLTYIPLHTFLYIHPYAYIPIHTFLYTLLYIHSLHRFLYRNSVTYIPIHIFL